MLNPIHKMYLLLTLLLIDWALLLIALGQTYQRDRQRAKIVRHYSRYPFDSYDASTGVEPPSSDSILSKTINQFPVKVDFNIKDNFDELTAAQQVTASAVQDVINAANTAIADKMGPLDAALKSEENVVLRFEVEFTKVDEVAATTAGSATVDAGATATSGVDAGVQALIPSNT